MQMRSSLKVSLAARGGKRVCATVTGLRRVNEDKGQHFTLNQLFSIQKHDLVTAVLSVL